MSRAPYAAAPSASSSRWPVATRCAPPLLQYLNRLSDLLFVLARVLNRHAGGERRAVAAGQEPRLTMANVSSLQPRDASARCSRGARWAISARCAELYRLTSTKLFGVALRILRREDWAEEVLQESYVNIWNHAADYAAARARR